MAGVDEVRDEARTWLEEHWHRERPLIEWRNLLADTGWGTPSWPVEWHGRGLPPSMDAVVAREFDAVGAVGVAAGVSMYLVAPTLLAHANDDQKRRHLRPILTGEHKWCQLFSEPTNGSDLAGRANLVIPEAQRTGRVTDPVVRQQIARVETLRRISSWTTQRARAARAAGKPPGPEGSLTKLNMSVTARACHTAHTMIAGSMGMLVGPGSNAEGIVSEILMSTPAMSIAGGTDEIQRNIIGERVLGLPKEPDDAKDIPYKDARRN